MKIAFAGSAVTGKNNGHFFLLVKLARKRNSISDAHLGSEVRDHADDIVIPGSEMERAIPSLRKSPWFALELCKETMKRNATGGKYSKVAMHGQDILVLFKRTC